VDRHVLQKQPNYCVPACIVMVEAWLGTLDVAPDERQDELFAQLNHGKYCSLEAAKPMLPNEGCGRPNIDDADLIPMLAELVQRGRRVVVTCWPSKLRQILAHRGLSSPHGPLPMDATPHHAIFVFGASETTFDAYDPWHTAEHQPIQLLHEEMALVWTGIMLIARK
jgi:hypothetical protein